MVCVYATLLKNDGWPLFEIYQELTLKIFANAYLCVSPGISTGNFLRYLTTDCSRILSENLPSIFFIIPEMFTDIFQRIRSGIFLRVHLENS